MVSNGLDDLLVIIPPFCISVFIGIQFFKRWQHRNLRTYLTLISRIVAKLSRLLPGHMLATQSLLQLWNIKSLDEFVEFSKANLQKLCSSEDNPHCFLIHTDDSITDFSSGVKVSCDFKRKDFGANKLYMELKSNAERKWFFENGYIPKKRRAYLICITSSNTEDVGSLLFLTTGSSIYIDDVVISSFISHASACLSRLNAFNQPISAGNVILDNLAVPDTDAENSCDEANELQTVLNKHFLEKTSADSCCFLFLVSSIKQIVCQVVDQKVLNYNVQIPADNGFFADAFGYQEPWFLEDINTISETARAQLNLVFNFEMKSVLSIPIKAVAPEHNAAIVCLAYKEHRSNCDQTDVTVVNARMTHSWKKLATLLALHEEREKRLQCERMLKIARNLFTHLGSVGQLLGEVIQEARNLTNAERCSVFLVDKVSKELVAKVFDGIVTTDESLDPRQYDFENMREVRMPLDRGIAGQVAITGKLMNIVDAYSEPLFYSGIDDSTGFKTRNILCFPIKDTSGEVVGVAELCNKIKGHCFTSYDEELAERFAVFCGISLSHSLLYKAVEESGSRTRLANELVAFHMIVDKCEITANLPDSLLTVDDIDQSFDDYIYRPRDLMDNKKIKACIFMYQDLGLISAFRIRMNSLVHFLLMVRKGYRDPPYHNWDHAFSVMHHAYLLAKHLQLNEKLGNLEVISLLTAALCHDVDHRGTNNAFQVNSQSLLANLYSSEGSVLERHHFAQAVCILSTAGCNIFEHMKRKDYTDTLALMKHLILATDVATHLSQMSELEEIEKEGLQLSNEMHKKHLLALCMTASDLSDQTKDWDTTLQTSKLIYKEFFYQGDMEKEMGNSPAVINDREKACVPQLQINFMVHIAVPVYRILGALFPEYEIVYQRVLVNIKRWKRVEAEFLAKHLQNKVSLHFLTDDFSRDLFHDLEEI